MIRTSGLILLVTIFIVSCNERKVNAFPPFLNRDSLPKQIVTIDNTRDTTVTTANGAMIRIPEGSFSMAEVKLEISEAYTMPQMILAGLTTETGGKILKSGGMIRIRAENDKVTFNKPIQISIPTDSMDRTMQLYSGVETNGKLDWTNPQPLTVKSDPSLEAGRQLYQANCASCHALDKILSGPALSGVEGRGPWNSRERLFAFTRNVGDFIPRTCYTKQLYKQYLQIMPSFPQLDDKSLTAIYDYIKNEDVKRGIVYSTNYNSICDDSCYRYDSLHEALYNQTTKRAQLIEENGDRINFERKFESTPVLTPEGDISGVVNNPQPDKVEPINYGSEYYTFEIKTFGWYNIDVPMGNEDGPQSELTVALKGPDIERMNVFIVIPEYKVFAEGGLLKDQDSVFGFYTKDGKIPLRPGTEVFVFAVGENSKGILFAQARFISSAKQQLVLEPTVITKKAFNRAVRKFRLGDVSIKADDSKNAKEIRKMDEEAKKNATLLESFRPKNCNCECEGDLDYEMISPSVGDSTIRK